MPLSFGVAAHLLAGCIVAAAATKCTFYPDTDYSSGGNNMAHHHVPNRTACCSSCASTPGCFVGVYNTRWGVCYLKPDGNLTVTTDADSIACVLSDGSRHTANAQLSMGTVALAAAAGVALVYVCAGAVYNWRVHGKSGRSLLPNQEFWSSCCQHTLQGCAITLGFLRRRLRQPILFEQYESL